jgi:uncharacterized protein (DUF885 family)
MSGRITWLALCLTVALVSRAAAAPPPQGAGDRDAAADVMRAAIERYALDRDALQRRYPNGEGERARLAVFRDERSKQLESIDFDKLSQAGRIDYVLLRNRIAFEGKSAELQRKQSAEVKSLLPFAEVIEGLSAARQRGDKIDARDAAKTLADLDKQITSLRKRWDSPAATKSADAPGKVLASRAARMADRLRSTLKDWYEFRAGYDPEFTWWMAQTYPKVEKGLQDYADVLRKKLAGGEGDDDPVIGDPIGRAALLDALEAEMIPYTPEELIAIGEREFVWCDAEMKRAASDLGFDGDWHKALDHVANMHVKPGEQPGLITRLAEEATKYVEDHKLVTVPALCKESWRMEMMTPQRQKVNPYFTGGEVISVSFPTDTMSFEDKVMSLRGNNESFCRATVFHELIPGHHLQIFMSERYNPHRRQFRTPFLVEGWALYWEMRLWDMGFPRSAEDRVGMLFWRAHRCARIIFSLKFHMGQMTAPEAIDFLVSRVGHERRNATAEVRRSVNGSYPPLYQAAYMLGGLQIRTMQKELVGSGRMTDLQFHDAILRENAIPIEIIRASLEGKELGRDFKTEWRFYGEVGAN